MANLSDAFGSFNFDFSNVKKSDVEIVKWYAELQNLISNGVYNFYLDNLGENEIKELAQSQKMRVNFSGCGCWCIVRNIEWFSTDKHWSEKLAEMDGLQIEIYFQDCDLSLFEYRSGRAVVDVKNGAVDVTFFDMVEEELTESLYMTEWDNWEEWCWANGIEPDYEN